MNDQTKLIEWNDGSSFKDADAYNNFDGATNRTRVFRTSECLIVHGNTEHGGENSLNKKWGHYYCSSKFSAVICQLNIDVHTNGGLQSTTPTTVPTTPTTTPTTTSSTTSITTSTTTTSSTSSRSVNNPNSSTRRRILRMAYHKDFSSTEKTPVENDFNFETLQTIEVLNVSHIMSNFKVSEEATTEKIGT